MLTTAEAPALLPAEYPLTLLPSPYLCIPEKVLSELILLLMVFVESRRVALACSWAKAWCQGGTLLQLVTVPGAAPRWWPPADSVC